MVDIEKIVREYSDNYSVKDHIVQTLIPKFFPDVDTSIRTTGTIGMISEQISNISEDVFNTSSVLFREAFANRAQLEESIYSHAAIFQISDIFATASTCKFLIVMDEEAILENIKDEIWTNGIGEFFIGRDTKIYVEDKCYSFDYPIKLRIARKETDKGMEYIYTAYYMKTEEDGEFENSISDISDPFVRIRRSASGYIAMEVQCHQCYREEKDEQIISNDVINYHAIDITFDGMLAGFDILYQSPEANTYTTKLDTRVVYSQPSRNPFCYYQMINTNTLRITFNTKDGYWQPEYNSTALVRLYITDGKAGNFDSYTGKNVYLVADTEHYKYLNSYLTAAQPLGASKNGKDRTTIDALQDLSVEGYRTALALTTEPDLMFYFSNYKNRFGDANVLFIRKRDDVHERVFSAYLLMKKDSYIFKTNTLNLKLNLSEMRNPENGVYILDPGYLFTANEDDGYATFLRDPDKESSYYREYLQAIEDGEIPYIVSTIDHSEIPPYLDRPASFAEFKRRHGIDDKLRVFDKDEDYLQEFDDSSKKKFLLVNPFLIRFKKNPNLVSCYMTYVNQDKLMTFSKYNTKMFIHFTEYYINIKRNFNNTRRYHLKLTIIPTLAVDFSYPYIAYREVDIYGNRYYVLDDKFAVKNNHLRVCAVLKDTNGRSICYTELYPTDYTDNEKTIVFEGYFDTDDHLTSNSELRLVSGLIYREPDSGNYYEVHEGDETLYNYYDSTGEVLETDIPVDYVTEKIESGDVEKFEQLHNMTQSSDIMVPIEDVVIDITTLHNMVYSYDDKKMIDSTTTNNIFYEYDKSMKNYIWCDVYANDTQPVDLLHSLDNVRMPLIYEDYTEAYKETDSETGEDKVVFTHDIMDAQIYNIPMLKWDTALDEDMIEYFMNSFYNEYEFMREVITERIRNVTILDAKFYNTYGRSRNFIIGEDDEIIDTVVCRLNFDVYYVVGTNMTYASEEIKSFIKETVETVNDLGQNNLYVSNLIRKIENTFDFVDHIRFNAINAYDSSYQTVKNKTLELKDLTVDERRWYVPEFLVCDVDQITLNEHYREDDRSQSLWT